MSGTAKTVLIVAGVGVGAYVLLQLIQGSRPGAPTGGSVNSEYALYTGLVNLGASIVQKIPTQTQTAPYPPIDPDAYKPLPAGTEGPVLPR
jgi:hypothetical protein